MFTPKKTILTAGPSVGKKEVSYVMDAIKQGWNEHYADYIHKFEEEFAKYVGVKYVFTTSGGTGALHLALATLGIGPGDEVILPEITYFACSDVVVHLGAKPVFSDILKDTWCIDPASIEKLITKKTRAIMPVYIYGNLCEMDEIQKLAKKHNLYIVEDACPAIGSLYYKKHSGTFGDFGAFSFQGAKIMVTGIGGMITTNSKKLYEKACYINNHGEDPKKKFWQTSVGYSFEMSNMQAAFGLGQLERIEEFVAKKRQIFSWYYERLKDIEGISFNFERANTRSNKWMTSIILNKKFKVTRDELIKKLKEEMVDSRPFFYPISMFPMYNVGAGFSRPNTPVAHQVGLNGINLPSGLNLTEREVDYVARKVKKILND